MKKYLILLAVLISMSSFGQKKWTLQDCVTHALENNISVKQAENNLLSNDQDIIASKGSFYPSLNANINQGLSLGNVELFQGQFADRTALTTNIGLNVQQTVFNGFRNTSIYRQSKINRDANEFELISI